MSRKGLLFTLFLCILFIASAVPVHATTDYYAVSFDGEDDYVDVGDIDLQSFTFFVILKPNTTTGTHAIIDKRNQTFPSGGVGFALQQYNQKIQLGLGSSSGYEWIASPTIFTDINKVYAIAVAFNASTKDVRFYNGVEKILQTTATYIPDLNDISLTIAKSAFTSGAYFDGKIYLILIYNRTISDSKIQQIYNDPLNPPTEGLVLFYAPDSIDTVNNIWTDKSGNENNGTIYNATIEQVSIPKLYVYDANTSTQIPYSNVILTLYFNNTTTGLIPSFSVLPYNENVTLNISAVGYESRSLSVQSTVDVISVYLASNITQPSIPTEFNYTFVDLGTLNVSANVSLEKMLNLFHHWPGGSLLDGLFRLNVSQFIKDVFTFDISVETHNFNWVGMLITGIIWFGAELFAWFYFKNPLPVIALGRVMYEGMAKFATPAFEILQIPIAGFMLYMGYLTIKMMFEKWSGER